MNRKQPCFRRFALAMVFILSSTACTDLTFQRSQIPYSPVASSKKSPQVIMMRGFLGIFSTGMDTLSERCNQELHLQSISVAALEWPKLANYLILQKRLGRLHGPLILVGHSEGADDQIEVARRLAVYHIPVDLLILIAPFNANPIPANVKQVVNLDRSFELGKFVPFLGYVPLSLQDPKKTILETIELSKTPVPFSTTTINHFNVDKNRHVQDLVLAKIKQLQ